MKKTKKKPSAKKAIKAKIATPVQMAAAIMQLQADNKALTERLAIAEAQIEHLLARVLGQSKYAGMGWPNYPYPYYEVITEVVKPEGLR